MYRICVTDHFDAAHHLEGYEGACARTHGHRWIIKVFVTGNGLDKLGMLTDFSDVKSALKLIVKRLDHYYLNEIEPFDTLKSPNSYNPTAENIARYIYEKLRNSIEGLDKVRVYESPDCYAEYFDTMLLKRFKP